jgi:protein ImuB
MSQRIVSIWFPYLIIDWALRRSPALKDRPFALAVHERNRRVIKAVNNLAEEKGIHIDMVVADGMAIVPELQILEYDAAQPQKLLSALAEWSIRYTPFVALDLPDGIIFDASGCTHLWGGEEKYLKNISDRFKNFGYKIRIAIADTIGTAWAVSRYGQNSSVVKSGEEALTLSLLPPAALRIEPDIVERFEKLGLTTIGSFINMPRTSLRRRFGQIILSRLDQALGAELEIMEPIKPIAPYQERLPSLEPICTATGIEIALKNLLEALCLRLSAESKGLRTCELRCYRVDGNIQKIEIGTNRPSRNVNHLYKLFEIKISQIEPDLGIELFILEAPVIEELSGMQETLWTTGSADETAVAELLDRLAGKTGGHTIHRYLPAEHYWPERSVKETTSVTEKPATVWRTDLPRPLHLLPVPELIEVSVPIPDYPPLLFKYKEILHRVKKADGPERIEQEWWIQAGLYRDYYCVEDDKGARYWVFRLGNYDLREPKWFLHGFFA